MAILKRINMDSIRISDFNLEKTLECGQIFRYKKIDDLYLISHRDKLFKVMQEQSKLLFSGVDREFISDFFRLDDDYKAILKIIYQDDFMREAIDENYGMRIMRQDPWECLISYLFSANNNIDKIKKNVWMISERFGRPILHDGHKGFSFPAPGRILDYDALRACKIGFHSKYIHEATRSIDEKMLISLKNKSYKEAKVTLMKIAGIGPKIADCISLFSLDKLDAFPVDRWIKKAMTEQYFSGKEPSDNSIRNCASDRFGRFRGYASQYLFFHRRMLN
jgi:N-glycosylase/DNA lyase